MRYLLALLMVLVPMSAWAANPSTFQWQSGDPLTPVETFYTVKCGMTSGGPYTFTASTPIATPPSTVMLITQVLGTRTGTFFCIVTASNAGGESGASNEVSFQMLQIPPTPSGLQVN